ncbi:MAG: hypothetical protein AAGF26_20100 [Cyanobacteria bacterium P01_G01_bin.49]
MNNYTFDPNGDRAVQSRELKGLESPKNDEFLLKIGRYIADGINYHYLEHCPEDIAIRDIIDYDAVNIDISRFPLLKLYRQTETFEGTDVSETDGIISYCLTYPQQDRLPGLVKYMSKAINVLLDDYHHQHEHCESNVLLTERKAEYRIMVNEVTRDIYPFLRFNFRFREQ